MVKNSIIKRCPVCRRDYVTASFSPGVCSQVCAEKMEADKVLWANFKDILIDAFNTVAVVKGLFTPFHCIKAVVVDREYAVIWYRQVSSWSLYARMHVAKLGNMPYTNFVAFVISTDEKLPGFREAWERELKRNDYQV